VKVFVDDQRCRGHGICTTLCPDVFQINEDGYA
jgi:ferredoxin